LFEATELSFTYPSGRRGLEKVSLKGDPGDRVVVMGPNGSGKSTLLRLVSTELPSPGGSLKLFGKTSEPPSRDVRRRIGIVQDTPVHVEDLTGMENGLLFAELYGLLRAEAAGALETLFTSLGLDPPSRTALLGILMERSQKGVCTLAATNDPTLAQDLATTVVLLHEGEVVANGSPETLLAKIGGATRIVVHIQGSAPLGPTPLPGLPADITSIQWLPGCVIAESRSGADVLPKLVAEVLEAGLKIERIELREPDLADVFAFFTGQALGPENK